MCGFCGFIDLNKQKDDTSYEIIRRMNDVIQHRGPDDEGFFTDQGHQLFFGHRRLSILDLSKSGSQPFVSQSGRMIIVFNGEIYNFQKIKNDIKGINWKSTSDTEVLIESIEQFGLKKTLQKLDGMFSFALWDRKSKKLYFARDRAGEKPLFYGFINNILFFGSELKSFLKHPKFENKINTPILNKYFSHGYIPTPFSIYKDIFKLSPGSFIEFDYEKISNFDFSFNENQYWSYKSVAESSINEQNKYSEQDYIDQLDLILNDSVKKQMIADVPLGAFLSGGVDSSLITAIMQKNSSIPIKTFTIGFKNQNFNEAPHAKKIADYLGTNHTEHYCSIGDAIDIIPKLSEMYDEPFADSSQIPTYLLSKLTRENVTVSLSGDAGDELFFGYTRYAVGLKIKRYLRFVPIPMRKIILKLLDNTPDFLLNSLVEVLMKMFSSLISRDHNYESVIKRLKDLLLISNDVDLYKSIITTWKETDNLLLNTYQDKNLFFDENYLSSSKYGFEKFMSSYDVSSYLNDDILVKVDKAAMAVSLETRIPFLSKNVIEFSTKIPDRYKFQNGKKKLILQKLLSKYIPQEMYDRPKMGFGLPINEWLKSELKDWTLDLLNEKNIKEQGILNYDVIMKKYNDHQLGIRSNEYYLWPILIFQQWMNNNK